MSTNVDTARDARPARGYTVISVALAAATGAAAAIVLSLVYGPAELYITHTYLNLFLAPGFGWAVGWAAKTALRRFRIGDPAPAIVVGLVSGLAAWWFAWLAYIWVISGWNADVYMDFLKHPLRMNDTWNSLAKHPAWLLKNVILLPEAGYYAAWVFEFLVIVGMALQQCRAFVRDNVACPKCFDWMIPTGDVARFRLPEGEEEIGEIARKLLDGDISFIPGLQRVGGGRQHLSEWLEVTGEACPECRDEDSRVTVVRKEITSKKGKEEQIETVLLRHAPITVEMEKQLFEQTRAEEPAAGPDEAAPMAEA